MQDPTVEYALRQALDDIKELRYAVFGNPLKVTQADPFDRESILYRLDRLEHAGGCSAASPVVED